MIEVVLVVASDGDGDGITFAISGGDQGGVFGIDENTVVILYQHFICHVYLSDEIGPRCQYRPGQSGRH